MPETLIRNRVRIRPGTPTQDIQRFKDGVRGFIEGLTFVDPGHAFLAPARLLVLYGEAWNYPDGFIAALRDLPGSHQHTGSRPEYIFEEYVP